MYWTDWGTNASIEKASMDGTNRQILHNTDLVWPNDITLDIATQDLYWVDASLDKVETSRVDGSLRRVLTNSGLSHPFGIVMHEGKLYISDWSGNTIRVMNSSGGPAEILTNVSFIGKLFGIKIVSPTHQVAGAALFNYLNFVKLNISKYIFSHQSLQHKKRWVFSLLSSKYIF